MVLFDLIKKYLTNLYKKGYFVVDNIDAANKSSFDNIDQEWKYLLMFEYKMIWPIFLVLFPFILFLNDVSMTKII